MADAPEVVRGFHTEEDLQGDTLISSVGTDTTQTGSDTKRHDFTNDEKDPKQTLAKDNRAGSGLQIMGQEDKETMLTREETDKETAAPPTSAVNVEQQRELPAQIQPDHPTSSWTATQQQPVLVNEWKHSFWEVWKPGGDFVEVLLLPWVLAGRTHLRLHDPESQHLPSINTYCLSCFGLSLFTIVGMPWYVLMTSAQRREIRYKYGIKGTNLDDCWRGMLCFWCSLMQEEKEILWHLRQERERDREARQMPRREDRMEYRPS